MIINTVQTIQLDENDARATATAIAASVTCDDRRPRTAYEMCPPSSCPIGNRLRAVASSPNQAPKAIGCILIENPSGGVPQSTLAANWKRSGSPRVRPLNFGGKLTTRDMASPTKRAGTATRK